MGHAGRTRRDLWTYVPNCLHNHTPRVHSSRTFGSHPSNFKDVTVHVRHACSIHQSSPVYDDETTIVKQLLCRHKCVCTTSKTRMANTLSSCALGLAIHSPIANNAHGAQSDGVVLM
jgi:hypothetical protein